MAKSLGAIISDANGSDFRELMQKYFKHNNAEKQEDVIMVTATGGVKVREIDADGEMIDAAEEVQENSVLSRRGQHNSDLDSGGYNDSDSSDSSGGYNEQTFQYENENESNSSTNSGEYMP